MSTVFYGYKTNYKNLGKSIIILKEMFENFSNKGGTSSLGDCGIFVNKVKEKDIYLINVYGLSGRGGDFGNVLESNRKYLKSVSYDNRSDTSREDNKIGRLLDEINFSNPYMKIKFTKDFEDENYEYETYSNKYARDYDFFCHNEIFGIQIQNKFDTYMILKVGLLENRGGDDTIKYKLSNPDDLKLFKDNGIKFKGLSIPTITSNAKFSTRIDLDFLEPIIKKKEIFEGYLKNKEYLNLDFYKSYKGDRFLEKFAQLWVNLGVINHNEKIELNEFQERIYNYLKPIVLNLNGINEDNLKIFLEDRGTFFRINEKTFENKEFMKLIFTFVEKSIKISIEDKELEIKKFSDIGDIEKFKLDYIGSKIGGLINFDELIIKIIIDYIHENQFIRDEKGEIMKDESSKYYLRKFDLFNDFNGQKLWKLFFDKYLK